MEIKTTAEIVREALKDDDGTPDALTLEDERKKWINFEELKKLIEKLDIEGCNSGSGFGSYELQKELGIKK